MAESRFVAIRQLPRVNSGAWPAQLDDLSRPEVWR